MERLVRAQRGDAEAREAVVSEHMALVKYVVKRFMHRGAEYDDLLQYGCLGLLKAIDRFDPEYSVRFSTYAVPVIMGEIRRYLRDDGPIHISRTLREQARRIEDYIASYREQWGKDPDFDQISTALHLPREDVALALNSRRHVRSLSEPVGGDGELRLMDTLGGDDMEAVDQRLALSKMLRDLPEKERMLLVRRYFKSHTQTRIAQEMGMTQVQVSRMESRILKRLRVQAGVDP